MIEIPILYAKAFVLAIPPFTTAVSAYLMVLDDEADPIRDRGITTYFILTVVSGFFTVFEAVVGLAYFLPYAIEYVVSTLSQYVVFV